MGVDLSGVPTPPVAWVFVALFAAIIVAVIVAARRRAADRAAGRAPRGNVALLVALPMVLALSIVGSHIVGAQREVGELALVNEHYGLNLTELPDGRGEHLVVDVDGRDLVVLRDGRRVIVLGEMGEQ